MGQKNQNNHILGGLFLVLVGALLLLRDLYPDYNIHDYSSRPLSKGHVPFITPFITIAFGLLYFVGKALLRFLRRRK